MTLSNSIFGVGPAVLGIGPTIVTCTGTCSNIASTQSTAMFFAKVCTNAALSPTISGYNQYCGSTTSSVAANALSGTANGCVAALAIALLLLIPHTVFMALTAKRYAPNSTTKDTPSCPTACGSTVPLSVFAFITSFAGLIMGVIACLAFVGIYFLIILGNDSPPTGVSIANGPGVICASIGMLLAFISMILDSASRCDCCTRRNGGVVAGGTTIIVQNAAVPTMGAAAYGAAMPPAFGAPPAAGWAAPPAQKLAPGWSQAGPDGALNANSAAPARCARHGDPNDPNTQPRAPPRPQNQQRRGRFGTSAPMASPRGRRRSRRGDC